MKGKWTMLLAVIGLILVGSVIAGPIMSQVEKPKYDIIQSVGDIEVRKYAPFIIAEVSVEGERDDAVRQGFRLLADYIFGNNTVNQDIAMTAPVQQQSNAEIAMTAPVQQQSIQGKWQVSFVMPSQYTMQSLPKPNNTKVTLTQIPEKTYVVIKFSGSSTDANIQKHESELVDYVISNQMEVSGSPKYAFYNPPWTVPFLRRNEVMMELKLN